VHRLLGQQQQGGDPDVTATGATAGTVRSSPSPTPEAGAEALAVTAGAVTVLRPRTEAGLPAFAAATWSATVLGSATLSTRSATAPALRAVMPEGVFREGSATLEAGSAPVARFWVVVAVIHGVWFLSSSNDVVKIYLYVSRCKSPRTATRRCC
jgi:hypothetical protein